MASQRSVQYQKCCVWDCNSSYATRSEEEDLAFYLFPSGNLHLPHKAIRRAAWVAAVQSARPGGAYWEPKKTSKICSKHFINNAKSDNPRSPSYIPTIFPKKYSEIKVDTDAIMEQHERLLERLKMMKAKLAANEATAGKDAADAQPSKKKVKRTRLTKATQIDLPDEIGKEDSPQLFICCHYSTYGFDKSDAAVQVYRPRVVAPTIITVDPLMIDGDAK